MNTSIRLIFSQSAETFGNKDLQRVVEFDFFLNNCCLLSEKRPGFKKKSDLTRQKKEFSLAENKFHSLEKQFH